MLRTLNRTACAVLSSLFFAVALQAADDTTANPEFLRLKTTYEKELQKIHDSDLGILVTEQDKYLAALRSLQKQMQESGKLDPVLVVGREIDRFTAAKKLDSGNISKELPDLVPLQNAYLRAIEKYPVEQARKILALVQNYDKALGSLQESLTKKNDIRGAVEVKAEKEGLPGRAEAVSARTLIAEVDAKAVQEKQAAKLPELPPGPPNVPDKTVVKPVDEKAQGKKKYSGSPEKRVKQKYEEFVKIIMKQDYAKAAEFVDPNLVKAVGQNVITRAFMGMFPFLEITDNPHRKLAVDSVKMNETGDRVTLIPKLWINNQWHNLPANKWIEVDGDWYLAIAEGEEGHPGEMKRMDKDEQGPGLLPRKPLKRMMDRR